MLLGAIAGGQKDVSDVQTSKILAAESELEKQAGKSLMSTLTGYEGLVNAGPGEQDMTRATGASRSLADLLQQYANGGFMPTAQDYQQSWSTTQNIFQPRTTQLQQRFQEEERGFAKQAQMMGRDPMDVVFKNRLAQTRAREEALLGADQTSFYQQQAMSMPGQRLNYMSNYANVTGGLASQALANRQNLLSMGNTIKQNEQNFRLNSATTNQRSTSGGGIKGAIAGGIAETGAVMDMASGFMSMGMGGGGGSSANGQMFSSGVAGQPQRSPY
jgi:hypothetical protein